MANPEHVKVVRQGAKGIAEWRRAHPNERINLSGASLGAVELSKADLSMAVFFKADLSGANLDGTDLSGANLTFADLRGASLRAANLSNAEVFFADATWAKFDGAVLTDADFNAAKLFAATLGTAKLVGTNLSHAFVAGVDFKRADLTDATCSNTTFARCQFHGARGLQSVIHLQPSSIGVDTLIESFRVAANRFTPELENFFRSAGVPQELLAALPGILAEVRYYNCFICYGEPDKVLAERLCKELEAQGVSCWLYSMDATPGRRTWAEIKEKRSAADKMVVLCSMKALVRDGMLKEIEEQIDEEPDKMLPVSLDDSWKEPGFRVVRGSRDLKPFLLERNYADFKGKRRYEQSLEKLLKGLERKKS